MADMEALLREVDALTPDELKQLYTYIIENRIEFKVGENKSHKKRIAGLHEHLGHAWMSDDFNAELPDSFWLGEDENPA